MNKWLVPFWNIPLNTGKTAAELIESRSNPEKPNMGLTTWRGSIVRKYDVSIAKNYLNEEEIKDLNEIAR